MKRPVSKTRAPMPRLNRAAQFAPFSALTGYGEAINETGRIVEEKIVLSPDEKEILDRKLSFIEKNALNDIEICVVYFVKDEKKNGGSYKKINGIFQKIDKTENNIFLKDGVIISIDDVLTITAKEFDYPEYFLS